MHNFNYSKTGLALTESFEGVRLTAYRDIKGVLTIGWGHTGSDVIPGLTITQTQADALLLKDVQHAADTVNRLVTIAGFSQDEFDSLVDLSFNVGCGAFAGSALLKHLNGNQLEQAAKAFEFGDKCAGQMVAGLLRRRIAEEQLFRKAD